MLTALSAIGLISAHPALAQTQTLYVGLDNQNGGGVSAVDTSGTVSRFTQSGDLTTGLAFGPDGFLYTGLYRVGDIQKIAPDGTFSTFVTGMNLPEGLAFDKNGNLYVANFGSGEVSEISPGGTTTVFAEVSSGIGGLAFNPQGDLFVSGGDTFADTIFEVTPGGDNDLR